MQEDIWEREYRNSKLLTKENKPQSDVVRFVEFFKKEKQKENLTEKEMTFDGLSVLDLGSGAGRNSFYFASLGARVTGIEISKTGIEIGKKHAREAGLDIAYIKQSMGEKFPCVDSSIDIVLDVISSNSLSEKERDRYLSETARVLKKGDLEQPSYFFVKTLCKEGDTNAKFLLKHNPGPEKDTYIMPELGLVERVWSKEDFIKTYEQYFTILHLEKKTSYTRMNDRVYKRNFWIAYMTLKS